LDRGLQSYIANMPELLENNVDSESKSTALEGLLQTIFHGVQSYDLDLSIFDKIVVEKDPKQGINDMQASLSSLHESADPSPSVLLSTNSFGSFNLNPTIITLGGISTTNVPTPDPQLQSLTSTPSGITQGSSQPNTPTPSLKIKLQVPQDPKFDTSEHRSEKKHKKKKKDRSDGEGGDDEHKKKKKKKSSENEKIEID